MASEFEADFSSTPSRRQDGEPGILARYNGWCPACKERIIAEQDRITFVALDINNYVHVDCAAGSTQTYSDPKPTDFCPVCWQARAANGTCGCL